MQKYKNFEKILVPLDGSKLSEAILPEVERLASYLNSQIIIMMVSYAKDSAGLTASEQQALGEALEYVNKTKKQLSNKGFRVDSLVGPCENIAQRILDYVTEYDIDLIMMCTHGYTGAKHLMLGSVAEEIVHHATIPVFLIRAK